MIGKGISDFIRIKKDLSLMEKIILDHRRELIETHSPAPDA